MKLTLYFGDKPPQVIDGVERMRVEVGLDAYDVRASEAPVHVDGRIRLEEESLDIRIEEHNGLLARQVLVYPEACNTVRLKGGVR